MYVLALELKLRRTVSPRLMMKDVCPSTHIIHVAAIDHVNSIDEELRSPHRLDDERSKVSKSPCQTLNSFCTHFEEVPRPSHLSQEFHEQLSTGVSKHAGQ